VHWVGHFFEKRGFSRVARSSSRIIPMPLKKGVFANIIEINRILKGEAG
jgi:hypothetical protein